VTRPGTQERNFTHVDDVVSGLLLIGDRGEGDEFGLGAEESYSILDIAQMFGGPVKLVKKHRGNRMRSKLDLTASHALGWTATRRVEDYIKGIVANCHRKRRSKLLVRSRVRG
jgi:UDP-glucose 4-epimerase